MNSSEIFISQESDDVTVLKHDARYVNDVMATAEKMHYITSGYVGPVLVFFGLVGNSLSLAVWKKKAMNSSTGMYLIAQAVNDIGVLTFFLLSDSLPMLYPQVKASYSYGVFYSYVAWPFFYFFVINSIWTLVGVTVDRYIQVCWINQAKMLCSQKAAQSGVALITLLCFIINTPHFNTYYPVPPDIPHTATLNGPSPVAHAPKINSNDGDLSTSAANATFTAYMLTEFGQGTGGQVYEFWVHCMFLVLAPWISILFMNLTILRRVTAMNKQMLAARGEKAQLRAQRKENQLTKLLLTVTFTFLALIALQCITQCFFMLQPISADMRVVNEAFSVAKLGIVLNSSINFLLYCVTGQRFRKELRLMLYRTCCRCRCLVPVPHASELYMSSSSGGYESQSSVNHTADLCVNEPHI